MTYILHILVSLFMINYNLQDEMLRSCYFMHQEHCIFCDIVKGLAPAAKVYEDKHVYAFMDISQVTTGHTLVIPKVHVKDIYDLPEHVASSLFSSVPKLARAIKKAYQPLGLNILNNNEVA